MGREIKGEHEFFSEKIADMKKYTAIISIILLTLLFAGCAHKEKPISPEEQAIEKPVIEEKAEKKVPEAPPTVPPAEVIPEEKKVEEEVAKKPPEEVPEKPAIVPAFPFADEILVYRIKWNRIPIGKATFICEEEKKNGEERYHFTVFTEPIGMFARLGLGFYRLESWADKKTLNPLRYEDSLQNGPRKSIGTAVYNIKDRTVVWSVTRYKRGQLRSNKKETKPIPAEIYDALTAFYFLRTRQFAVGQGFSVPVNTYKENVEVCLNVLKTQKNSDSVLGKIDTFKVQAAAKTSQGILRQEKLVVWFTADGKNIPVHYSGEAPIGSGTMSLTSIAKASTQKGKAE